jgi:adenylate cyclase
LLRMVAEGRTIKAIAAAHKTTAAAVADEVDKLFVKLAAEVSTGTRGALERLKSLHQAIVDGKEQGESLSRLLPGGIAEKVRQGGKRIGETERLLVTVVMSDIRGYSTIAEGADPSILAGQISQHRGAMNHAILAEGGTIMQFVGDAVMAVYGAPFPQEDHADRAVAGAINMHRAQEELNERWKDEALPAFGLGIGVSTGEVAAALMGSVERLEYSVVGDSVNLAQRIQNWAGPGEIVLSENTYAALRVPIDAEALPRQLVKGRVAEVVAYKISAIRVAEV